MFQRGFPFRPYLPKRVLNKNVSGINVGFSVLGCQVEKKIVQNLMEKNDKIHVEKIQTNSQNNFLSIYFFDMKAKRKDTHFISHQTLMLQMGLNRKNFLKRL